MRNLFRPSNRPNRPNRPYPSCPSHPPGTLTLPVLLMFLLLSFALLIVAGGCAPDFTEPAPDAPAPVPPDALVLTMLYGSEKQAWIDHVTETFNAQQNPSLSGRPIFIETVPIGSLESLNQIVNGEVQPAIWSPASRLVFPLANDQWASSHGGDVLVDDSDAPSLVLSPVVIAMWKPMAEAMGWPDTPLGWSDIASFSRENKTWADYGYPEWGPFKFGHTHPDYSNSGFTTIIATAYAGAGMPRTLTLEAVQQPGVSQFIADVEETVIHYGESTGFFGRRMIEKGPAYLSAAVLYENLVMESYDRTRYPNIVMPIVAIYPREGTFWSDHPFAILPWAQEQDEVRTAAEQYRAFLLARPQQELALQYGFRPVDSTIPVAEAITPDQGVDPSQPASVLRVPPADVMRAARAAWGEKKKRVEVLVLLDISGSMNEENRIVMAKEGLTSFVQHLADADRLGLVVFNNETQEIVPLSQIGPKRQEVLQRLSGLFASGNTRLIDTVKVAYENLQQQPRGETIRALVVLSDGADTASTTTQEALTSLVSADEEGYSIKIFTIAYGSGGQEAQDLLRAMSEASGGKFYQSDPTNIGQVYLDISRFF
jgi:Ca-activated chloride channel homolog